MLPRTGSAHARKDDPECAATCGYSVSIIQSRQYRNCCSEFGVYDFGKKRSRLFCFGGCDLASSDPFGDEPIHSDVVRFVSVLAKPPRVLPSMPISLPEEGRWPFKNPLNGK